ncbi:MAG: hypothetical protein Q7U01_16085 [Pseudomonas sp.]|nr:hypothetical protein [Pseudomonas sp.]
MYMRVLILGGMLASLVACASYPGGNTNLLDLQKQASSAYAAADYSTSTRDYRALVEALPQDAEMRYRLGNSLAKERNIDGAIEAYREALMRDAKHAKAWHNLIYLQLQGVGNTVAQMYLHIDRSDPSVAPLVSQAEVVMQVFDVSLDRPAP